jgi:DNA-binding HxlR family transcriptional regulator
MAQDVMTAGIDCTDDCPVRLASDLLSGKWTTLIFRELLAGTKRYTELQHALLGVSPKILASRLRMLSNAGLVNRKIYATVPPKTEYSLTDLGREVEPVIRAMADFGVKLGETAETSIRAA